MTDKWMERTKRNLATVHPILQTRLNLVLAELASEGINAFVSYGGRTIIEQDKLYAIGRTKPGKRVTDARGGFSYHNYFVAADVLCLDDKGNIIWDGDHHYYTRFGAAAIKHDLAWGFHKNGKHWDKGHVNLRGFTMAQVRTMFQRGGIKQVWEAYDAHYKTRPASVVTTASAIPGYNAPTGVLAIDSKQEVVLSVPASGSGSVEMKPAYRLPDVNTSVQNEPLSPPFYEGWIKKVVSASIAAGTGGFAVVKNWWERMSFTFGWRDVVIIILLLIIIRFWWKRNVRRVK